MSGGGRGARDDDAEGPLWADGDMLFRVEGLGGEADRPVKVRRPFALIGRTADADIAVDDREVSSRHVYLHLDRRGVYAVDLVTRTGTRINGQDQMVGWLRPGDSLEVAGRRIELLRIRLGSTVIEPGECHDDMLADNPRETLVGVTLEPRRSDDPPWVLGSELIFLGWSASCGIQIKDTAVARTHCALLRSPRGAFLIDLSGRQTWVEDRPVRGASILRDGDLITIGSTGFTVRLDPPLTTVTEGHSQLLPVPHGLTELARFQPSHPSDTLFAPLPVHRLPIDPELIPAEAQTALLAWMMGTIQGGQVEVLRRQGEFQQTMTEVLRQIQQENATLLNAQLQRIEGFNQEIAALRAEIERRHGRNGPPLPPLPDVAPLRINRPNTEPDALPNVTKASTHWLLNRVSQLEDENRSAWKDLLGRLSQSRKPS